jgi:hypothetical protein
MDVVADFPARDVPDAAADCGGDAGVQGLLAA